MDRIENAEVLDRVAGPVSGAVNRFVPAGAFRDLLHGVPIGHPAHPLLVQVPLGAWLSTVILDHVPGGRLPSTVLAGVGTAAALPAAAAGILDWAKTHQQQQRVGLVHWASNTMAVGFFAASFVQRVRGRRVSATLLAELGLASATAGGFLGGHLAYRQAVGSNHDERVPFVLPDEWYAVGPIDEVPDRRMTRRIVDAVPVLVYRVGDRVWAIADECSHLAGPLSDGDLVDEPDAGPCVTCPWHGSEFSLTDGAVVHGPATSPQHVLRTRVRDGQLEVSAAG
ncbi:hypothetical protein LK09_00870 [Microbacterium mangrovi]|uniref:Rieske domain-containing protein n=2 Tax=Microbacterium mangrovi TaxID=1348253 RepID=A0A0B2ADX6_9MICO|nr:hypothetical protein LK09_00870 [Microbacterium mangrovi]